MVQTTHHTSQVLGDLENLCMPTGRLKAAKSWPEPAEAQRTPKSPTVPREPNGPQGNLRIPMGSQ